MYSERVVGKTRYRERGCSCTRTIIEYIVQNSTDLYDSENAHDEKVSLR